MSEPGRTLIPVTLLTGFLGSGKTTLLGKLLLHPQLADSAVLINEFGEVAIDHHLVRKTSDNEIVVLANGCLCCTVLGDLVAAMKDLLFNRGRNGIARYPRIFIETSGLADPAPVLNALVSDPQVMQHYRLDGVVTTVDAQFGATQLDRHRESLKQVAIADRIVITKADLASADILEGLLAKLRGLNPAAEVVLATHGEVEPDKLLNTGLAAAPAGLHHVERWISAARYRPLTGIKLVGDSTPPATHEDGVSSFVVRTERRLKPGLLLAALSFLCAIYGEQILRVKGVLNLEGHDHPEVLHIVQHVVYPLVRAAAWPDDDRHSVMVFILHKLDPERIHEVLASMLGLKESAATSVSELAADIKENVR